MGSSTSFLNLNHPTFALIIRHKFELFKIERLRLDLDVVNTFVVRSLFFNILGDLTSYPVLGIWSIYHVMLSPRLVWAASSSPCQRRKPPWTLLIANKSWCRCRLYMGTEMRNCYLLKLHRLSPCEQRCKDIFGGETFMFILCTIVDQFKVVIVTCPSLWRSPQLDRHHPTQASCTLPQQPCVKV